MIQSSDKSSLAWIQQIIIGLCGFVASIFAFITAIKLTLVTGSFTELVLAIVVGIILIKKYPQQKNLKALSWGIVIGSGVILLLSIIATSFIFAALQKMIS